MAYWDPEIILKQKRQIDIILSSMEKLNESLLADLGVYSSLVKDEVSVNAKNMIIRIDALLQEIRENVERQTKKMEEGAKGLLDIESNASSIIRGIK